MAWDNFIDDLKMQVNIVDVVGREVSLKKAGANYKGLCPFHSEKTPSFMVNEEKQIFNCFGCGHKGDVIKFVQEYYKLPFMEAVEKLCGEYGSRGVFIGVPCIIGRNGVKEILELSLTDDEMKKFRDSAAVLEENFDGLKL